MSHKSLTPKKKRKAPRGCKCIDEVDKLLKEQHAQLTISFGVPDFMCRTIIATERTTPRAKIKTLIANYCPFCGKKYPESDMTKKQSKT
jgi:hypothetical protein